MACKPFNFDGIVYNVRMTILNVKWNLLHKAVQFLTLCIFLKEDGMSPVGC